MASLPREATQPQLVVRPPVRASCRTAFSWPQSHRQVQRIPPWAARRRPLSPTTVSLPNRWPVRSRTCSRWAQPQLRVCPLFSFWPETWASRPQAQRQFQKAPCPAPERSPRPTTVRLPKRRPVKSSRRTQPQLTVLPCFKFPAGTRHWLPQAQRHSQTAPPLVPRSSRETALSAGQRFGRSSPPAPLVGRQPQLLTWPPVSL